MNAKFGSENWKRKGLFGRHTHRWENSNKVDFKETGLEGVDWTI
jgi:hypothetical protein